MPEGLLRQLHIQARASLAISDLPKEYYFRNASISDVFLALAKTSQSRQVKYVAD